MPKLARSVLNLTVIAAIFPLATAFAQEVPKQPKPFAVYRLEFAVRELQDGKRLNTRSYAMLLHEGLEWGKARVGNRVPITTGPNLFQYFNVGLNIDCRVREEEGYVLMDSTIEISSIVEEKTVPTGNPVVREAHSEVHTAVPPGKPTVISTLDDVSSNHRYEVEVTATKVK